MIDTPQPLRAGWRALLAAACLIVATAVPSAAQVYVDDSTDAVRHLEEAKDRLSKNEPEEAARLVQRVMDDHGGKLLELEAGRYAEARRVASTWLAEQPDLLKVYQQLYHPPAEAMLTAAGRDRDALVAVMRRFGPTESGLSAGLRIAGLALESGDADGALIVLDEVRDHPSLEGRRGLWRELRGAAAVLRREREALAAMEEELKEAGDAEALRRLESLAATVSLPDRPTTLDPLDELPPAKPPALLRRPLWELSIDGAERFLIDSFSVEERALNDLAERGRYLNTMAIVHRSTLMINDGQSIYAIEPSSGRLLWKQTVIKPSQTTVNRGYNRWLPHSVDLSGIGAHGNRVVGVMGYGAMATAYPYYRVNTTTTLACVDATDGRVLWEHTPTDIDEDISSGYWFGRPIVTADRVFVTFRRRQRTGFRDGYVVALRLSDGQEMWRRHVASTAMANQTTSTPLTHMRLRGGWLYVDSRLGTVCRIAASDGRIDWLTVVPVSDRQRSDRLPKPWHASSPLVTEAGLLVLDDWEDELRVFDPASGRPIRKVWMGELGEPIYLLRAGADVVGLGSSITKLDGKTLDVKWQRSMEGRSIKGRAVVAGDELYAPIDDAIEVIDLSSGKTLRQLSLDMPVNLLLDDGQLVAAQRRAVRSFSSWEVASKQLERLIQERPRDARPLTALAWLAFQTGRREAMTDALDRVIKLVNENPNRVENRGLLFEQLLEMAGDTEQNAPQMRQQLFERMAVVAQDPSQEVAYRLTLADFYEQQGQRLEAVAQYQALLSEPTYRKQVFHHADSSRQAGLEARDRLSRLIEEHGPALYEPYEAFAQQRLNELRERGNADDLVELVESHPMATVAPTALVLAAGRAADDEDSMLAISLLRRAERLVTDEAQIAEVYGREAELFEQQNKPRRALRVLRRLASRYPQVKPMRGGAPTDVAAWISELAGSPEARRVMARIDPPLSNDIAALPGAWMRPTAQDPDAVEPPVLLLRTEKGVAMHGADDLATRWSHALTGDDWELLSIDPRTIWLWNEQQGALRVLETDTGELRWSDDDARRKVTNAPEAERLREPLEEANDPRIVHGRVVVAGDRQFRVVNGQLIRVVDDEDGRGSRRGGVMIAVSDVTAALADESGHVVVVDSETGEVRWRSATAVNIAEHLLLDGRHVVIAGLDDEQSPIIAVYDAQSGVERHRLPRPKSQQVLWIGLTDDSRIISVSARQVESFDLATGESRWVCAAAAQLMGEEGVWLSGDRVVVQTRQSNEEPDGDLIWIDQADGRVVNRTPTRGTVEPPIRVSTDGTGWFVVGRDRAIALGPDGRPIWRDAIDGGGQYVAHLLTQRYLVLLGVPTRATMLNTNERMLYILDRAGGAVMYQHKLAGAEAIDRMGVVGGRFVIGSPGATAVFNAAK